ncbi:hypothetical protein [uncultured Rhodospira sp.]|uniref:hypothetical protein n=1 Tax=uncultured Rhodospira sp. TaxID=1936189 RepID=UPI00262E367E|nr:hypothetical protein [uncultured Rhodospira sp.]
MTNDRQWYAGVDWASQSHHVVLTDDAGTRIGEKVFKHSGDLTTDIANARSESANGIAALRADLSTEIGNVRADAPSDAAALRGAIAALPGRGVVVGTVLAIFALCAGMVAATVASLHYLQP